VTVRAGATAAGAADTRYRCIVCDARWAFEDVRHVARCRDCGGALLRWVASSRTMASQRFTGTLSESARGGGRWVEVPFDPREAFGQARAPVRGTVNGTPLRSRLAIYGGKAYLGLTREIREAAGLQVGDDVDVFLELDDAPREVDVPEDLRAALDGDDTARAAFEALSFTHRREYAQWIAEAKQPETRERRVAKTLEQLRAGQGRPRT
jgi:DNA-directed RNA polymerase subunit RPC12/RpoP